MGHKDHGAVGAQLLDRSLDVVFADVVQGRRPFVEHEHWRILEERSGQGNSLALAAREVLPMLLDQGLVTVSQRFMISS